MMGSKQKQPQQKIPTTRIYREAAQPRGTAAVPAPLGARLPPQCPPAAQPSGRKKPKQTSKQTNDTTKQKQNRPSRHRRPSTLSAPTGNGGPRNGDYVLRGGAERGPPPPPTTRSRALGPAPPPPGGRETKPPRPFGRPQRRPGGPSGPRAPHKERGGAVAALPAVSGPLSLAAPHAAASLPTPSNPWVTPQRHMPHDPLHTVLIPRPGLRIHTQGNGGGGGGEAGNVYHHHHPPRPASEQRPTTEQPPPMPPRAATPGSDPLPRATLARLRSSPREAAVPSPPRRLSRSQLDREPARGPSPASRPLSPPSRPIGCPNYGGGASARRLAHGCVYPGHGGHNPASRRRLPTGC